MQAEPPHRSRHGFALQGVVDPMEVTGRHTRDIGETHEVQRVVEMFGQPGDDPGEAYGVVAVDCSFAPWWCSSRQVSPMGTNSSVSRGGSKHPGWRVTRVITLTDPRPAATHGRQTDVTAAGATRV